MADHWIVSDEFEQFGCYFFQRRGVFYVFVSDVRDVCDEFRDFHSRIDEGLEGLGWSRFWLMRGRQEIKFSCSNFDYFIFSLVQAGCFQVEGDEHCMWFMGL